MVEDVVRGLIYVRADDVVGSDPTLTEYGLEHPFVEVEARFADGATRRLRDREAGAGADRAVAPRAARIGTPTSTAFRACSWSTSSSSRGCGRSRTS